MKIEITIIDIIILIISTIIFVSLEAFTRPEIKLNKILKLIPIMMIPSAFLIIVWKVL